MLSIRAELKKKDNITVLNVPCNDYGIDIALANLGETDMTMTNQFCSHLGGDIRDLQCLSDRFIDVDELNFLAKRLDSFTDKEMRQFQAAMMVTNPVELKDIINLTYNLHNYTLITDFSDMAKVGRTHRLNVEYAIPTESDDGYDYAALGESLVTSGKGVTTPYGVLFVNGLSMEEIYDGKNFPDYHYEDCIMTATLRGDNGEEYLYLPCGESAIKRTLHRLGVDSLNDCNQLFLDGTNTQIGWLEDINPHYTTTDIYAINSLCAVLTETGTEITDKLIAVCQYAGVHDLSKAVLLAENIDSFEYSPDASDEESLGRYLIKDSGSYAYDEELDDYYDYERLGADTVENQHGKFGYYGYVGIKDDITLEDILSNESDTHKITDTVSFKLYSPLNIKTEALDNYGDPAGFEERVSSDDAVVYKDDINKKIRADIEETMPERGIAEYLGDELESKIKSAFPSVEEIDGKLYGVLSVVSFGVLTDREMDMLKDEWSGQASDGWGEGFEQHPVQTSDEDIFVSFWDDDDYFVKTQEEFDEYLAEQNGMSYGGIE